LTRISLGLLPFMVVAGLWQALATSGLVPASVLPSAFATARALLQLLADAALYTNLGATLLRCFAGLLISVVIGVPLGAWMATSRLAEGFFTPLIRATYSLPKTALVPLFILWFGVGIRTEIGAVLLSALLPLTLYAYHGVRSVPRVVVWSAQAMGTPPRLVLWRVLLPASLQASLTGLRIALGFTFVIGVATEMLAANSGIGKLIFIYGESGAYDFMFAAILALMCAVYAADTALLRLTTFLLRWQDTEPPPVHA
jgi:ABC-type nitrate/sulfonate/bicarbonate transport system permease component